MARSLPGIRILLRHLECRPIIEASYAPIVPRQFAGLMRDVVGSEEDKRWDDTQYRTFELREK